MFHTQEKRSEVLISPIVCVNPEAWLGDAFYFWYSEHDAYHWGNVAKRKTGYFEVYQAEIDCEDVLDTVFNEAHYTFWLKNIEKAKIKFAKAGINEVSLSILNNYFKERNIWTQFRGIMFQDISTKRSGIKDFHYIKRIQLGVFDVNIIANFELKLEYKCV